MRSPGPPARLHFVMWSPPKIKNLNSLTRRRDGAESSPSSTAPSIPQLVISEPSEITAFHETLPSSDPSSSSHGSKSNRRTARTSTTGLYPGLRYSPFRRAGPQSQTNPVQWGRPRRRGRLATICSPPCVRRPPHLLDGRSCRAPCAQGTPGAPRRDRRSPPTISLLLPSLEVGGLQIFALSSRLVRRTAGADRTVVTRGDVTVCVSRPEGRGQGRASGCGRYPDARVRLLV